MSSIKDPKWTARDWAQDANEGRKLISKRQWPDDLRLITDDEIEIDKPKAGNVPFRFGG